MVNGTVITYMHNAVFPQIIAIPELIASLNNKVVIELSVAQFWSEIILVILNRMSAQNHANDFRPNCIPPSSITIIFATQSIR